MYMKELNKMENIPITIQLQKKEYSELTEQERLLVDCAKEATYRSYSPYSHFCVGASLMLDDGTIVKGCNQENSSYPQGLCAERTALFAAGAAYPEKKVIALCIAARGTDNEFTRRPIAPCGGCRQVMSETEDRYHTPMKVLLYGTEGTYIVNSAKDLLPVFFDASYM